MPVEHVTPQKRSYDPEGMRRRILNVAADAFQKRGYHATSMQDVMGLAELSGGALHHHFPTKKALGLAVIRERVASEIEQTWVEPFRSAASTADALAGVFRSVITDLKARASVTGCPLNNLAIELILADPDFRVAVEVVFDSWRTAIARSVRDDQAEGKLGHLDADDFPTFVVATFSGAMGMAKTVQHTEPLEACARQLERMMSWSSL
jgi:TetR/AcrR family transcriptional repressor of nem operon